MADQPYTVSRNRYGAHRWQWHCQATVTSGLLQQPCSAWGLGRTRDHAAAKARDHIATAHPATEEPTR